MAVTGSLGTWQLSRAAEKQALEDLIEARASLPAWDEQTLTQTQDLNAGLHRPVRLQGEWVSENSVFLDNRPMGGHSGFILVTPLRLKGDDQSILVQRGWVPRDFGDRTRVPAVATPTGLVTVAGRLAPPPSQLFELGEAQPGAIRQNIVLPAFATETGLALMQASVLQTGPPDAALQRDWPRFAAGVAKHQGYAFQWFAMCTTTAALYLWFQFISPRRKRRTDGPEFR
ncbi:SURF1 family protein [Hydrogenophaga sp. PAMC20947]|nr:SURF1 family protein [Hydrogenophaga sp. PAMC20947]